MYEDRTYENMLPESLKFGDELGVDTRPNSVYHDTVSGVDFRLAKFYADLDVYRALIFVSTATGEFLDEWGYIFNVSRNPATPALYEYTFEGIQPDAGERFFTDGLYFSLISQDGRLLLQAESPGSECNNVTVGASAMPVQTISGLSRSEFGNLVEPGTDIERDDSYRRRIQEKMGGPAENGNRQHYKSWCEADSGVGRARIIPLGAGRCTVLAALIGVDGTPAAESVVQRVQEKIDPITLGVVKTYKGKEIVMGDGLGNGVANIGAHFAAYPAESLEVHISFQAVLASGATKEQLEYQAAEALREYFKELSLSTKEGERIIVRVSTIGAMLYALEPLVDYSALTINGQTGNIELEEDQIPVLEGVIVDV